MLLKIPKHLDPVHLASLSDNIQDAYPHLGDVENNPSHKILIVGGKAKSVGIYSLLLAKAKVDYVDYVDDNQDRLRIARKLKADNIFESYNQVVKEYGLVIDVSSTSAGLKTALRSARNFGTISSSGIYIRKASLSLLEMYSKGVNLKIGLVNARADASRILNLLKKIEIPFELVTTKLEDWSNAESAFLTDTTKVIVRRERITHNTVNIDLP